jgi:hypothetical protein
MYGALVGELVSAKPYLSLRRLEIAMKLVSSSFILLSVYCLCDGYRSLSEAYCPPAPPPPSLEESSLIRFTFSFPYLRRIYLMSMLEFEVLTLS